MTKPRVLIVEDETLAREFLRTALRREGYETLDAESAEAAHPFVRAGVDVALLDYMLPGRSGLELLRQLKTESPTTEVIVMTASASTEVAVAAMKEGAFDYLRKPLDLDELLLIVGRALEAQALRREVETLRASVAEPHSFDRIIGESPPVREAKALLRKIGRRGAHTVLLCGESGTGKDLAAKALHYNSERAGGPFINVTCSAIPEALLESELFGHERGAFTDAKEQKKGLLELADGGTAFLDEIGDMSLTLQAKLLRFLEEKEFRRVGGTAERKVDVRVIAATNRDLEEAVRNKSFRSDLYFRLRVMPVTLPPLRERAGDVTLLAHFFVARFGREFAASANRLSPEALRLLEAYAWPGNVRELKNAIERALLLADGDALVPEDFALLGSPAERPQTVVLPTEGLNLEALERELVRQALARTGGNQTRAGALLGLTRDQIRYRLEKYAPTEPGEKS